jgi:hypothetical protein
MLYAVTIEPLNAMERRLERLRARTRIKSSTAPNNQPVRHAAGIPAACHCFVNEGVMLF